MLLGVYVVIAFDRVYRGRTLAVTSDVNFVQPPPDSFVDDVSDQKSRTQITCGGDLDTRLDIRCYSDMGIPALWPSSFPKP